MKNEETMMLTEQLVELIADSIAITNQYEINIDGEKIDKIKNILKNNNNYFDIDSIISNHLETVTSKMNCKKLFEKTWCDNLDSLTKGIYNKLHRRDKNMFVEKTLQNIVDNMKITVNCQDNSYEIVGLTEDLLGQDYLKIINYLQSNLYKITNFSELPTFIKFDKGLKDIISEIFDEMNKLDIDEEMGDLLTSCHFNNLSIPDGLLTEVNKVYFGHNPSKNSVEEKTGHIMIPDIDKIKIILNELIERNGIFIIHHDEGIKVILNYDLMMKKNLNVNEFDIMSDIIKDTVERTYNKSKICKISITKLLDELSLVYNDYVMNIEKVIVF